MTVKLILKVALLAVGAVCLAGFPAPPSFAQTFKRVSAAEATAENAPILTLFPGYGLNISFISTGEIIEKVWLDDSSWIVVDADGCLQGLSESDCKSSNATVLHLREIKQLNFPGLLQSPNRGTLLSAIARSRSGNRRLYAFRIVPSASDGPPQYHTVEVTDPLISPAVIGENRGTRQREYGRTVASKEVDSQIINRIERGIKLAVDRRFLVVNSELWQRLSQFVTRLKQGYSLELARGESKISVQLVNRLLQLGDLAPSGESERLRVTNAAEVISQ